MLIEFYGFNIGDNYGIDFYSFLEKIGARVLDY